MSYCYQVQPSLFFFTLLFSCILIPLIVDQVVFFLSFFFTFRSLPITFMDISSSSAMILLQSTQMPTFCPPIVIPDPSSIPLFIPVSIPSSTFSSHFLTGFMFSRDSSTFQFWNFFFFYTKLYSLLFYICLSLYDLCIVPSLFFISSSISTSILLSYTNPTLPPCCQYNCQQIVSRLSLSFHTSLRPSSPSQFVFNCMRVFIIILFLFQYSFLYCYYYFQFNFIWSTLLFLFIACILCLFVLISSCGSCQYLLLTSILCWWSSSFCIQWCSCWSFSSYKWSFISSFSFLLHNMYCATSILIIISSLP